MPADPRVEELHLQIRRLESASVNHAARAERYRDILDHLPIAVARLHTDGVVGFANRACCEALGLGIEDIIGRSFAVLCAPEQRVRCEAAWKRLEEPNILVDVPALTQGSTRWTFQGIFASNGALESMQVCGQPDTGLTLGVSESEPGTAETAASTPPIADSTILVVDDEKMVCTLAQKVLEKYGYRVLVAQTGREAMDMFHQHLPSIGAVLLDMSLPDIDGQRVLKELRELKPQLPVIVSSGYEALSHQRFQANEVIFLPKPYMPDQLISKVREVLQKDNSAS